MWTYEQSSGRLLLAGKFIAVGYSGNGNGKNNSCMENIPDVGPIPKGFYTTTEPYFSKETGPYSIGLAPRFDNNMFGRSGFLIHGDSREHPGNSSHGCIILQKSVRQQIWESGDQQLEVV